jgi:hypothetical protein
MPEAMQASSRIGESPWVMGPPAAALAKNSRVNLLAIPLVIERHEQTATGSRVVRQLQVAHNGPVPVGPPCLPQVHAYIAAQSRSPVQPNAPRRAPTGFRLRAGTRKPLTGTSAIDQAQICLPAPELRLDPRRARSTRGPGARSSVPTGDPDGHPAASGRSGRGTRRATASR